MLQGLHITCDELTAFFPVVRVVFVLVEFYFQIAPNFIDFMAGAFFHPHHVFFNEDDFSDEPIGHLDVELDVRVAVRVVRFITVFDAGHFHSGFLDRGDDL